MKKNTCVLLLTFCIALAAAACSAQPASPSVNSIGTAAYQTIMASFSAIPGASLTPALSPTFTPTQILPLPVPPGWGIFWNEQYGFAFSHPALVNCHWSGPLHNQEGEHVVSFLTRDTCLVPTDSMRPGVEVLVLNNSQGLSVRQIVDQEKVMQKTPGYMTGPDVVLVEEPFTSTGQAGILLKGKYYGQAMTAYIPFPAGQRVMEFTTTVGNGDFTQTALQILSTLRFVEAAPALSAMATQTETAYASPAQDAYAEFTDLEALSARASFPLWLPTYLPEGCTFTKGSISVYTDQSAQVSLEYSLPGDPLDANVKRVFISMTKTDQPLTLESLYHRPKLTPRTVGEADLQGASGMISAMIYWSASAASGNLAHLEWRADGLNFHITLSGDWPAPDEIRIFDLQDLLTRIAAGLKQQ
jgi:hypothetical protein